MPAFRPRASAWWRSAAARLRGRVQPTGRSTQVEAPALSRVTLGLVADICQEIPAGRISIVCDKHGGRNSYAPLLSSVFPDASSKSTARGGWRAFTASGRPSGRRDPLPAKADRTCRPRWPRWPRNTSGNSAMLAFNAFWSARVPGPWNPRPVIPPTPALQGRDHCRPGGIGDRGPSALALPMRCSTWPASVSRTILRKSEFATKGNRVYNRGEATNI